jgi:hypothetical protein
MWKAPAPVLWLAALPLIGCARNVAAPPQTAVTPSAAATSTAPYYPAPRIYAVGPSAPAAVLVLLPGEDSLVRDPRLWEAQGFDVVTPPADIYHLVADQQAALARLVASAEALANAPVWLVGPSQAIEAAIPRAGGISGVVMTSVNSNTGSCSESVSYFDPGTGAPPKVEVRRSGDCGAGLPNLNGQQPFAAPVVPRPNSPRIIEASAIPKNLSPAARVKRLAELIKGSPSS